MPTAFSATWSNGKGPAIMAYAEYDAVPGNCQIADTYRAPRQGLSRFAGGHTDPHSALGMGAFVGALAAKAAMEKHGITGTIRFMGEPAEKVRGSKPIHAARGYYDGLDAIISFHPHYMLPYCNTCRWDTHCGPYYAAIYEFLCESPKPGSPDSASGGSRSRPRTPSARAPGANDAVVAMYTLSKMMRDHMLPHTGTWTLNETILASGQATADNLAAQMALIMYAARTSDRGDAGAASIARARPQCRSGGRRRALHGEAALGVEIARRPRQSCDGRNHLPQSRARRSAELRRRGDRGGAAAAEGTGPRAHGRTRSRRTRDD